MDDRLWSIVDVLSEIEYKTAGELGALLGVSEKTMRTRLRGMGEMIKGQGAVLVIKQRYGYCLKIVDKNKWEIFRQSRYDMQEAVPADSSERVEYMLAAFLNRMDYIKLEDLADFLYVSTKTLSNELKRVEYVLSCFHISLIRKPHYGIRSEGREFDKRCCILQNFYLSKKSFWGIPQKQKADVESIASLLLRLAGGSGIKFTETAFQNTVLYIHLSISRMHKGMHIEEEPSRETMEEISEEISLAEAIYREWQPEEWKIPRSEICYAGIYIAGKRILGEVQEAAGNIVVSGKTDQLVSVILEEIYLTYQIELRNDLNLRIMLIQHLQPMEIRLKYGIPVEFHVDVDIKERYFLAYTMAQMAVTILSGTYEKTLPENERLCIAMYFAMALEEKKALDKRKNRILLVCISGKASSRMLMYRFQKEFGDYIESLRICGMYEFDSVNLSDIDFIFTTVPIYKKVPVPIMEIHDFLESSDIMSVRHFLQVGDMNVLNHFYRKELFFSGVEGDTRETVVHEICKRMRMAAELPEEFEASVLQRETLGPTDFGNFCAIPHPCRIMTKETLVAVAVLEQEILWFTNPVRVVILTSLKEENNEETQKFYEITAKFLSDREAVRKLIEKPDFEQFEKIITALKR